MKPWFRYYVEALDDPKVQGLEPALFKHWINCLCVAAKNDGYLPSLSAIVFGLRVSDVKARQIMAELEKASLVDPEPGAYFRPHNWDARQYKSDTSTERVNRHRQKKRNNASQQEGAFSADDEGNASCNADETLQETHQNRADQNRTEKKDGGGGGDARSRGAAVAELIAVAPVLFKKFWTAGPAWSPKRRNATSKAFLAALKAGECADAMIAGARIYGEELAQGGETPADPLTWLCGRRWVDVAPAAPVKSAAPLISDEAHALADEVAQICGYARPLDWPPGWHGAPLRAQRWINEGYAREIVLVACRETMTKKRDGPPASIRYFEKAVARALTEHNAPLPQVAISHHSEVIHVEAARRRNGASSFQVARDRARDAHARLKASIAVDEVGEEGREQVVGFLPARGGE